VGYATAKVLATTKDSHFHVIMTGRSLERVNKAAEEIETTNGRSVISTLQMDVTDEASIQAAVTEIDQQHGRLDGLINNAAVGNIDPDVKTRMTACLVTNVIGPAMVADAFRPLLLKSSKPYSIFVSSGAGSVTRSSSPTSPGFPHDEAYRASKAALNMVAVREHVVWGPKGLWAFTMCPGFVVSNLRGPGEEARTGGGNAADPSTSAHTLLSILQGERDADVGKFVHKDGIYSW
jgi:NAD(P)-dependent dehydrogenase (short-subunit alcohol dehydrogenase family)